MIYEKISGVTMAKKMHFVYLYANTMVTCLQIKLHAVNVTHVISLFKHHICLATIFVLLKAGNSISNSNFK